MSDEDIKSIYKAGKSSDVNFIDKEGKFRNYSAEFIYDVNIEHKILDDFSNRVKNQTMSDILNAINYLKVNASDISPLLFSQPYRYVNKSDASKDLFINLIGNYFDKKSQLISSFKPEIIIKKIDSNEPVILGFLPYSDSGHAVLGYKYEYVDVNTFKVFVSDSNYPLLHAGKDKAVLEKYNQEICNNFFVLFKRDNESSRWQFTYNPKINYNYVYRGMYNSYIPQFKLMIQ